MAHSNPWVPQEMKDAQASGVRRSVAALMDMIDTEDPAFQQITDALKEMQSAGVELDAAAVSIAIQLGRSRYAAQPKYPAEEEPDSGQAPIVYYIQRGDLIKIGTTSLPEKRFRELLPDAILAYEPGGLALEASRHRQFASSRVSRRGEYFRPTAALTEHIAGVRRQHGEPDPAWPTTKNLTNGFKRTRFREPLPEPTTDETVTVAEGAERLRIKKSTIQGWVHRGLIKPVGRNPAGARVYPFEHMQVTLERNHDWFVCVAHKANRAGKADLEGTCAATGLTVT